MDQQTQTPVYASPKEVAGRIAAAQGERPAMVSVAMVGSQEVEKFVTGILDAQKNTHAVVLKLD